MDCSFEMGRRLGGAEAGAVYTWAEVKAKLDAQFGRASVPGAGPQEPSEETFEQFQEGGLRNVGGLVAQHVKREKPREPPFDDCDLIPPVGHSQKHAPTCRGYRADAPCICGKPLYDGHELSGAGPAPQEETPE